MTGQASPMSRAHLEGREGEEAVRLVLAVAVVLLEPILLWAVGSGSLVAVCVDAIAPVFDLLMEVAAVANWLLSAEKVGKFEVEDLRQNHVEHGRKVNHERQPEVDFARRVVCNSERKCLSLGSFENA